MNVTYMDVATSRDLLVSIVGLTLKVICGEDEQ
jgi:hypothetical protein